MNQIRAARAFLLTVMEGIIEISCMWDTKFNLAFYNLTFVFLNTLFNFLILFVRMIISRLGIILDQLSISSFLWSKSQICFYSWWPFICLSLISDILKILFIKASASHPVQLCILLVCLFGLICLSAIFICHTCWPCFPKWHYGQQKISSIEINS